MEKFVVAGGAGFLGTHLCAKLLEAGHKVVCLDNFLTGQERNILSFLNHPRFSLVRHDVVHPLDRKIEADALFNLACPGSPAHYQVDPVRTTLTSVLGAFNILEWARDTGAKVFQASTSEVYGEPAVHPQVESYCGAVNPIGERACYDEGKRCAESLFFDYHRMHKVRIKVVRIFNTYGPCMHPEDGRVVSNLVTQALSGRSLTIYGNGRQTRSFCYCDDLIDGFIRMMDSPDDFTGPVNLGNPEEFTILELAEKVQEIVGGDIVVDWRPPPGDDPTRRKPDIALARDRLGWEPGIPLEVGLRRTVAYFEELFGNRSK